MSISKGNFDFLQEHDPIFYQIGSAAERAFAGDPNTTLLKLRQLAEALAQNIATRIGIEFDETVTQASLLYRLNREIRLNPEIQNIFHTLRIEGNRATHQFKTQHKEAMDGLRLARTLAIWSINPLVNREQILNLVPSFHRKIQVRNYVNFRYKSNN